jgi:F-type H+-transporting ATPase subunit b
MEFFKENISLVEVLVQLFAFLIVFLVLKKYAWQPVLNVIKSRRERFAQEWADIEKMKAAAAQLEADYKDHLRRIEDESRAKMQEAIREGRLISRDIQEKARAESQASFEKAKANLEAEVEKARLEFRRDIARLSLQVAEKVLGEKMDSPQQEKKASELIDELEKKL